MRDQRNQHPRWSLLAALVRRLLMLLGSLFRRRQPLLVDLVALARVLGVSVPQRGPGQRVPHVTPPDHPLGARAP